MARRNCFSNLQQWLMSRVLFLAYPSATTKCSRFFLHASWPDLELAICPGSPVASSGKECFRVTMQTLHILFQAPSLLCFLPCCLLSPPFFFFPLPSLLLLYWLNAYFYLSCIISTSRVKNQYGLVAHPAYGHYLHCPEQLLAHSWCLGDVVQWLDTLKLEDDKSNCHNKRWGCQDRLWSALIFWSISPKPLYILNKNGCLISFVNF